MKTLEKDDVFEFYLPGLGTEIKLNFRLKSVRGGVELVPNMDWLGPQLQSLV
jgi:hypothetical protein